MISLFRFLGVASEPGGPLPSLSSLVLALEDVQSRYRRPFTSAAESGPMCISPQLPLLSENAESCVCQPEGPGASRVNDRTVSRMCL